MSTPTAHELVRRLWQYCNVLRDDGLSYPDYVEQLTYLLFLKLADERGDEILPARFAWRSFASLDAESMHRTYGESLAALGNEGGTLGLIFRNARNKISDPAKLRLLVVDLIGETEWLGLSADLKGDAYEGLLEKNARDTKSGAGQYFTPRPLIDAVVECVDPVPGEVILDPACGTGGFLLAAHEHILRAHPRLSPRKRKHLRTKAIRGVELVQEVARLAAMNLFLHDIAGDADDELPIVCADSLAVPPAEQVDVVLSNPPFGVKGSVTYAATNGSGAADALTIVRPDFWVRTANKQLNFVQHIAACLGEGGRAAIVVPDNVLYESGAAVTIRRRLLESFDVHTLLRVPAGLFYASGINANVLFLEQRRVREGALWVYDLRSGNHFSLKKRPLRADDLHDFVTQYGTPRRVGRAETLRWRRFAHADLLASDDVRLDLAWDVSEAEPKIAGLARVEELSAQIAADLEKALEHLARAAPR
ncbi:class I SAM-dependent DNA methyltransferase [Conexibacter sp. CPCC 206217]|uniref:class I SAM-dependent DNA methyltransferase n=1 Tax=Conexibacter sp. CPCC 206217 TaxID=3064574 RepID=UPI00271AD6C9|nr:class I SAM-dependent DNA methyltransferase [Conexibacter sp. CPCC 206217]MDO8210964.1 class I SAM-dependent DNA methyltransferase [Conexibacter sp. CPCC 206217]